jgi:DNA-binding response OmpR family regulator
MAIGEFDGEGPAGRVLIVDDDPTTRSLLRGILARQFDVVTASSGEEALALSREHLPDLVLLDVEMPGLGGYETCRRLCEIGPVPVIFATAHQSLEEHLKAYDAGASDLVTKPVTSEILLRKVGLAIDKQRYETRLAAEKESLQKMAMGFLSSMGETGSLLKFMRAGVTCRTHEALARQLVAAARDLGMQASVMIRHVHGPTLLTTSGSPTPLEQSILGQLSGMGRIFQFRSQLVVNYERVSIIVGNMPDEVTAAAEAGRLRDNVAILAETAEALCDNVDMRQTSTQRAEQMQVALGGAVNAVEALRDKQMATLADTRVLLQELMDNVEKSYSWLDTTQAQEKSISAAMHQSVQRILAVLAAGGDDLDIRLAQVIGALRQSHDGGELEFF